jgi:hypothetical protein
MKQGSMVVVAVVIAIGLLDAAVGALLLISSQPWQAHGPGTVWSLAPRLVEADPEAAPLLMSLFRRVGAFSLHVGVLTTVLGILGRHDRRILSLILAIYTIDGIAFFLTDRAYFAGTPYLAMKQIVGTAWTLALAWHIYEGWRART